MEDKKEDTKTELILGIGSIIAAVLFALYLIEIAVEHPGENGILAFLLIVGGGTICCLFILGFEILGKAYRTNKVEDKEDDQAATMSIKEATAITTPTTSEEETEEETALVVVEDDTVEKEENK